MRVSCRADQTNGAGGGGAPSGGFGNLEANDGNNPPHMPPHATPFTSASNSATSLIGSELLTTNPSLRSTSSSSTTTTATTASGPPHYVDLHVSPGECVSLQLLDGQEQVVAGPATITMISQQQTPPVPIPVQVPHGHMIHQIADENGTLKHIILSVMDTDKNSAMDSSVIDFPHASFRIDSLGELVSTIDGQMYGYPACCCCCYCDPDEQNAAAAAAAAAAGVPLGPNGQPVLPLGPADPLMAQQQQQDVIMMALMQQDIGPSPGRRGNNNRNSSNNISTAYHNNNNNNHHHHNHHTTQSNLAPNLQQQHQQVGLHQSAYHPMSPLMTHSKEFGRGKAHHHGKGPRGQNPFKQQQQQNAKLSHSERAAHHHHHQNQGNNGLELHHPYNNHAPTYTSVASGGLRNIENNIASHKQYPLIQPGPMKQQQQHLQSNSTPQQQQAPPATTARATAAHQHQQQQRSRRPMSPMFVHTSKEFSRTSKQHQGGGKSSRGSSAHKQPQGKATSHVERSDPNEVGDHNHNNHRHPSQNHNHQQRHNNQSRTSDSNHINSHHNHNHNQQHASEPESLSKRRAEKSERIHHKDDEVGAPGIKQVGTNPASSTSCDSGVSVAALESDLVSGDVEPTAIIPSRGQLEGGDRSPSCKSPTRDSSKGRDLVMKEERNRNSDPNAAILNEKNAAELRDCTEASGEAKSIAQVKQLAERAEGYQEASLEQEPEQAQAPQTTPSQPPSTQPLTLHEQQQQSQQQPQRKTKKQATGDQSNSNKRNKDNSASLSDGVQLARGKQKKVQKGDAAVKRSTTRQRQRTTDGVGVNNQVAEDDKSQLSAIVTESLVKVAEATESGKPLIQSDKRTSTGTTTASSGPGTRRDPSERTVNAKSASPPSSSEQTRNCPSSSRAKESTSSDPLEQGQKSSNYKQVEPVLSSAKHHNHQHANSRTNNPSPPNRSSNNNNNHHHNHHHHHHHNHHNSNNQQQQQSIKVSNLMRQYRNKFATNVGKMVQNSLSSYSDTKFAGLLLIIFTMFAMLLAIFIHYYIIAPVNA